jgi:hypothetical protein
MVNMARCENRVPNRVNRPAGISPHPQQACPNGGDGRSEHSPGRDQKSFPEVVMTTDGGGHDHLSCGIPLKNNDFRDSPQPYVCSCWPHESAIIPDNFPFLIMENEMTTTVSTRSRGRVPHATEERATGAVMLPTVIRERQPAVKDATGEASDFETGEAKPETASTAENRGLADQFDERYQAVAKIDEAISRFEIKRRRTAEYWTLGQIAVAVKKSLPHGKWLLFLKEHGYVERTVQRAIRVYTLFADHEKECAELTLEQVERVGQKAKKPKNKAPKKSVAENAAQGDEKEAETVAGTDNEPVLGEAGDLTKAEILWEMIWQASDEGFETTDEEDEAFAAFMASVGDDARAVRVLIHRIQALI